MHRIKLMRKSITVLLVAVVVPLTGCHHYGFTAKRKSELECPTDIRQTVPWCAGEDAVFHCPCGPSGHYYGARPPGWRPWPTSGAEWRDAFGAMPAAHGLPLVEPIAPGDHLQQPTEALPDQETPSEESSFDFGPASSSESHSATKPRIVNPSYEGLELSGRGSGGPMAAPTTENQKAGETRRAPSFNAANGSWIHH